MARFSDEQIRAYVEANIDNPAAIAEAAALTGVSMADLSRATGFSVADVSNYFGNAGVEPPAPPTPTYSSTDEQGNPIYDYVAPPPPAPPPPPPPPPAPPPPPPVAAPTPPPAAAPVAAGIAALPAASAPPTIASLTDAYNTLGATYTTSDITDAGEQVHVQSRDLGGGFGAWEKPGEIIGYNGQGEDATPIFAPATLGGFTNRGDKVTNYYDTQGNFLFAEKDQSLTSQILSDLSPVISMVVPFIGAELGAMLNVSAATGTAIVKAGLQVAQGAELGDVVKGMVVSEAGGALSSVVTSELANISTDALTQKLITSVGSAVVNSVVSGNTDNIGTAVLGSVVSTVVTDQTGNAAAGADCRATAPRAARRVPRTAPGWGDAS